MFPSPNTPEAVAGVLEAGLVSTGVDGAFDGTGPSETKPCKTLANKIKLKIGEPEKEQAKQKETPPYASCSTIGVTVVLESVSLSHAFK